MPVLIAVGLVLVSYAFSIRASAIALVGTKPVDYYGHLTDAFSSGQLFLKLEPDPRLGELENPWAGAQDVPRIHDATYFNGKYYLYFGATPAVLVSVPWRVLTGTYLTEASILGILAVAGFLLSVRLWLCWSGTLTGGIAAPEEQAIGVLALGFGSYVYFLLQTGVFYHVPIVAAYACLFAAFNFLDSAWSSRSRPRVLLLLGMASLTWALAVGGRPNYVLSLPLLAAVAGWVWGTRRGQGFPALPAWQILAWATVPAAAVGAGLAAYNYARFGDIGEFGIKYQFAAIDQRFLDLSNPANLFQTLRQYLLAGAYYTIYFPFALPRQDTIGILIWAPFTLLALLLPLVVVLGRRAGFTTTTSVMACTLCAASGVHLFSLCLLPFANDRYLVDFVPGLLLAALLVCAGCRRWLATHGILRPTFSAVAAVLLFATIAHSVVYALQRFGSVGHRAQLAKSTNHIAHAVERIFNLPHGAVEMTLRLDEVVPGRRDPLVVTGFGRDAVYLEHLSGRQVRFGFLHEGSGGPTSDPIELAPGQDHHVRVELGSLYPPRAHPIFAGWDESIVDALLRKVEVEVNARTVLHWNSSFYASDPLQAEIGRNSWKRLTDTAALVQIHSVRRAGVPSEDQVGSVPGTGPIRLTVKFPPFRAVFAEPLVSTGRPGAGDLVYVKYLAANRLRFGHDSWGAGSVETREVEYDPEAEHVVEVDMPALRITAPSPSTDTRLQLRFDGRWVASIFRPFNPSSAADLALGFNATGSTSAERVFTGPWLRAERTDELPSPTSPHRGWGPLRIIARLPDSALGRREPVVVSGIPGRGDFIFIVYEGPGLVRFGHDHWGQASTLGPPVRIDPERVVELRVSMASLYPLPGSAAWGGLPPDQQQEIRSHVSVQVEGETVLSSTIEAYPAEPHEVYVGQNPIGGSTCDVTFTGRIDSVERDGIQPRRAEP